MAGVILKAVLLGIGLAMDAFSVSMADGMHEKNVSFPKILKIAAVFAGFQFLMPMIGWIAVHTVTSVFDVFMEAVPWVALILLLYIGGGMIKDGIEENEECEARCEADTRRLLVQGIATSVDALSVGFTIAEYSAFSAFGTSSVIAIVTFILCGIGVVIGKKFGMILSNRATIVGGMILIFIGIEIFAKGIGLF